MAKIKGGTKGGINDSLFREEIGKIVKTGDGGRVANIIEFTQAPWGLNLKTTPVQTFMLKTIYGMPLDDKTPVVSIPDTMNSKILYDKMTEMEFAKWSYEEGRCNIDFSDPNNWDKSYYNFVFALGRRSGKCREENDYISTTIGSITFKELLKRKKMGESIGILTYDADTLKQKTTSDFKIWSNGAKACFDLKTNSGIVERSTGNHPYLVWRNEEEPKFVDLSEIKVGDRIAISKDIGLFGEKSIGINRAKLLGYLTGDGATTCCVGFTNTDQKIIDEIQTILNKEFSGFVIRSTGDPKKYQYRIVKKEGKVGLHVPNDVKEWLKDINCFGSKAIHKDIPESIYRGSKEESSAFLSRLFACDGWASVENKAYHGKKKPTAHIGYCSASYKLAYGVKRLLLKFGIHGVLRKKKVKLNGKDFVSYQIEIAAKKDIETFAKEIGIFSKEDKVQSVLDVILQSQDYDNRSLYSLPKGIWNKLKRIKKENGLSNRQIVGGDTYDNNRLRMQYCPNREKIASYGRNIKDNFFIDQANSDVFWDTVKSIKDVGKANTVDLCVEGSHIIGGELVSHNSTLCSCVVDYEFYRLFKMGNPHEHYNVPAGQEIAVIGTAPTDGQAQIVFNMAKTFSQNSPIIKERVAHPTQTYFEIQTDADIKNYGKGREGSMQFITGGSSSNAIRGHNAIIVLIDEMAFFTENGGRFSIDEVYGALTPSIAKFKNPDTGSMDGKVICLSSPYAHFGKFYDLYRDSFTEESQKTGKTISYRYYTSLVNPENASEEYLREERRKDKSKFRREFESEFDERITSWIDSEVQFRDNIRRPYGLEPGRRGVKYFYGFDFGSTDNGAAISIVHKDNNTYYLDYSEVFYPKNSPVWEASVCTLYKQHNICEKYRQYDVLPFFEIADLIKDLTRKFPMFQGVLDQYSGHAIYQILQSKGVENVDLKSYNESSKARVFKLIKELYQENLLNLMDHPVLIQEMLNMESELRPGNKVSVNKRASSDDSFQDDITDSYVRAVWECWSYNNDNKKGSKKKAPPKISFGTGRAFGGDDDNEFDLSRKLRGVTSFREMQKLKYQLHGVNHKRNVNGRKIR